MHISDLIVRLRNYYGRQGFRATVVRAGVAARRALFTNRMVLFYCDLPVRESRSHQVTIDAQVEEKRTSADLKPGEWKALTAEWNPEVVSRKIGERFARGAQLWTVSVEGQMAGYGWTLRGSTIEPHYFPLGAQDLHLFDFHVFSRFRGRGINPYLVRSILNRFSSQTGGRAYIEAAEWNRSQLSSLGKTPFQYLGTARKCSFWKVILVSWTRRKEAAEVADDDATAVHRQTNSAVQP